MATPLMDFRMQQTTSLFEELFVLSMREMTEPFVKLVYGATGS